MPASRLSCRAAARSSWGLALGAFFALAAPPLAAADWVGSSSANWSTTSSSGWNGTVPNGVGAIANFAQSPTSVTVTNDVSGLTVGSISMSGTSTGNLIISTTSAITLNQDGSGSGSALLRNSTSSSTASLSITGTGGSLVLADDLALTNTSTSVTPAGALRITVPITGTGSVTLNSTKTNFTNTGGTINLVGTNTFTGNVAVQTGTTSVSNATAFGNSTNVVTVGLTSAGNASIFFNSSASPANSFVIAAGTGGTTTFATNGSPNLGGGILLNGDLTIRGAGGTTTLSGVISGSGRLNSTTNLSMTGANTYQGGTAITGGILTVSGSGKLGSGITSLSSGGSLSFANRSGDPYAFGSGDTLSGTGTVALSNTVVTVSGLLAPGIAGTGALTMTALNSSGTLQFDATTKFAFTLGASGTNTSLLFSTGNPTLDFGNGVVNFDDFSFTTGSGFAAGNSYTLISGASTRTGDLGSSLSGLIDSSTLGTLSLSGNNLVLTVSAIPEPSAYAAGCGVLALLGTLVRKRRARAT